MGGSGEAVGNSSKGFGLLQHAVQVSWFLDSHGRSWRQNARLLDFGGFKQIMQPKPLITVKSCMGQSGLQCECCGQNLLGICLSQAPRMRSGAFGTPAMHIVAAVQELLTALLAVCSFTVWRIAYSGLQAHRPWLFDGRCMHFRYTHEMHGDAAKHPAG